MGGRYHRQATCESREASSNIFGSIKEGPSLVRCAAGFDLANCTRLHTLRQCASWYHKRCLYYHSPWKLLKDRQPLVILHLSYRRAFRSNLPPTSNRPHRLETFRTQPTLAILSHVYGTRLHIFIASIGIQAMAKSKALIISGPMNAKHLGGIDVMGGTQPSILDNYFDKTMLEPDELPSHTYVATGNIEVPKRSDTIAGAIRRPSGSLRRSFSKLRRNSISHPSDTKSTTGLSRNLAMEKPESVAPRETTRQPRTQTSLSRLRHRVGLDKDLYEAASVFNAVTPDPEIVPEPIKKDSPRLQVRKPLSRAAPKDTAKYAGISRPSRNASVQRKPSSVDCNPASAHTHPSVESRQPVTTFMAVRSASKLPVNPKRIDSGTAITLDKVPFRERPLPFQEIMAVKNLAERMAMYKRTQDYWAYADHGLIDWTSRASGPKFAYSWT